MGCWELIGISSNYNAYFIFYDLYYMTLISIYFQISKLLFLLFMFVFVGKLAWQLVESVQLYRSYPTGMLHVLITVYNINREKRNVCEI